MQKHGPPVYVRHEIVHNRYVVESLETQGAVFVEDLSDVPDGVPVVFSAYVQEVVISCAAEVIARHRRS